MSARKRFPGGFFRFIKALQAFSPADLLENKKISFLWWEGFELPCSGEIGR